MTWLPSPWPCLGMTGSHGNSDVIGGSRRGEMEEMMFLGLFSGEMRCLFTHRQAVTALCVSRPGSKPAGSLSVNPETQTTDWLARSAVCYCISLLVSRQGYQSQAVLDLQCELKTDVKRNDLAGFPGKVFPLSEMAINRPKIYPFTKCLQILLSGNSFKTWCVV